MPYALDNGCCTGWEEQAFLKRSGRASQLEHKPLWVLLPDVVADHDATMQSWQEWVEQIAEYKIPLAFACQDGATPNTVPKSASCLFIGGTTHWKLENAHRFKGVADWLHIGRVNTRQRLSWAKRIGADSVDGTGFFRGDKEQIRAMIDFATGRREQLSLFT